MTQFKKCKVVLLPTKDLKAPLFKYFGKNEIFNPKYISLSSRDEPQHLYILSDEDVKVGDWYLVELFKITGESTGFHLEKCMSVNGICVNDMSIDLTRHVNSCNKIIATTDSSLQIFLGNQLDGRTGLYNSLPRPSDSFIKKYCELGGINEVTVEYEEIYIGQKCDICNEISSDEDYIDVNPDYPYCIHCKNKNFNKWVHIWEKVIKITPDNTIKKIKEMFSLEEVKKIVEYTKNLGYMDGSKPQQEFTISEIIDKYTSTNL